VAFSGHIDNALDALLGSANINVLVFYRPSTWKCLDCGYEGAFILEDSNLAEKICNDHRKKKQESA